MEGSNDVEEGMVLSRSSQCTYGKEPQVKSRNVAPLLRDCSHVLRGLNGQVFQRPQNF